MKRTAAVAALIALTAACSSSRKDDELPSTIPPAEVHAQAPASDSRVGDLQASLTELLDRLDVLNARIAKLEAAQNQPVAAAARPVVVQPAAAQTQPAAVASTGARPALHDAQIAEEYRKAIVLVSQNKATDARAVFQRVFDQDPSGDLADNALFWIGETYFGAGDYSNAMRYYERVAKEYADQNKAPDAIYKLGIAFERTGDLGMARRTFDEVIAKYPYSSPAAAARMELKKIKY
jgi:tol-pal system protein YbgF